MIIFATININGQKINALITHFGLATVELNRITQKTCELIDDSSLQTIMMGNFNVGLDSKYILQLDKKLINCAKYFNDNQCTFSLWNLNIHIDHIYVSNDIKVLNYKTYKIIASDHIPITAQIEL